MTPIDTRTEAVEALLKGVTPGPWKKGSGGCSIETIDGEFVCRFPPYGKVKANTRFIAAARELVPALLAERDALRAEVATCVKYRDAYAECDRIGTQAVRDLEAKLTKAVEALETIVDNGGAGSYHLSRTTLAELNYDERS